MRISPAFGLGERGAGVYASLVTPKTDAARKALALEAARTADRLEDLDQMIQGKGVLNLMMFRVLNKEIDEDYTEMNINVEVQIKSVLSEARQQGLAYNALLKTLQTEAPPAEKPVEKPKATPEDEIERKRTERARLRQAAK